MKGGSIIGGEGVVSAVWCIYHLQNIELGSRRTEHRSYHWRTQNKTQNTEFTQLANTMYRAQNLNTQVAKYLSAITVWLVSLQIWLVDESFTFSDHS